MCFERELAALCGVAAHRPGSFPHPFPPSFHCLFSVMGAVSLSCVGAHGWVVRICQPWEKSPSRSWLPIVEAPNLHLAMQLLMFDKWAVLMWGKELGVVSSLWKGSFICD